MVDERGVLRRIVWRNIFPGVMLFHCFRLSIAVPILFLSTIGFLSMHIGPWLTAFAAGDQISWSAATSNLADSSRAGHPDANSTLTVFFGMPLSLRHPSLGLLESYLTLVRPFAELFDRQASLKQLFASLGVALWYLLVWAVCGGAITRIAVVRLGTGEHVTLRQSVRHAVSNLVWYFSAPLFPLVGVALAVIPLFVLGLIMRLSFGVLVAGVLWPLVLLDGLLMALLLAGLLFGWPLMWPTISAEEASDSFQAFSNSFSFTLQRPLQYLAYAMIALLVCGVGGVFVEGFANAVVALNHWAISFGLGRDRMDQLLAGQLDSARMVWIGGGLITLGDQLVRAIAAAYYFSFLFCTASAIYLLLRREVDQTDFDEVYMPETTQPFRLPPLRSGPHGVPEIDEPLPSSADKPSEADA